MRRPKIDRVRLSRAEKEDGGIHFDYPKGHAKAANGIAYDLLSDAEVDELLAEPEPCSSTSARRYGVS